MALIPGLNYVESNINQELVQVETPDNTSNATLIIGTAREGKTGVLTKVASGDARDKFGDVPTGSDFETNAVHAALAIQASTASRNKEMYVYKVGDSASAELTLYENQYTTTGDTSFSKDDDGNAIVSIVFEANSEGNEANSISAIVRGESGLPSSVVITLPDGYSRVFAIDPFGVRPGIPQNVADLALLVNEDTTLSNAITLSYSILRKSNHTLAVQAGSDNYIEVGPSPTALNESWGDKLVDIESIKQEVEQTDVLEMAKISQRLTYAPDKDESPSTATIKEFTKIVEDESHSAAPTDLGQGTFSRTLAISDPSLGWDEDDGNVTDMAVVYNRSGILTELSEAAGPGLAGWEYASGVIDVNLTTALDTVQLNDKIEISYKFSAYIVEANVRSELITGNENSYFVAGSDIVFGAAPSLGIEVTYDAIKTFQPADINVDDFDTIRISFINPDNAPDEDDEVAITFTYLPELPAPSGTTITGDTITRIQGSALAGGTSGSLVDKQRYRELVETALDDTMMVPFRRVIISGALLDDTVAGIDQETGLAGLVNLNWSDLLSTKLAYKSRVAGECHTVIGVRPISTQRLASGQGGINEWLYELLEDFDDPFSPASQMAALDAYHVDVALGASLCSDSTILGGAQYVENPAYIVTGMQLDNSLAQSLIRSPVPGFVKRLLVTFPAGLTVGRLNTARYSTLIVNARGDIKIGDAPTASDPRKTLARQLVRDTVFATLRIARDIAETFIGLRRDARTIGLMQSKINRDVSRAMITQEPQLLTFFNAEVLPTPGGYITGETRMRLVMETSVEIRTVVFETTVKLGGEEL